MHALAQYIALPCLDSIIYPSPPTITSERTLWDVVSVMRQSPLQTGFVLVLDEMRVVGLLTEHNIVQVAFSDIDFKTIKIFEVMETSVITLKRSEMENNIVTILTFLLQHHLPALVVVDDEEKLIGVITYESICHSLEREGQIVGVREQLSLIESAVINSEAKQQLQAVIDAVPGFVSWVSADGHYLGVNHRLAESLNLTPSDFVGQSIGFTQINHDIANFIQNFVASPEIATSHIFDMQVYGTTRNYLITAHKYQQGQATVLVGIDITETKQVERALQQALLALVKANAELEMRVEERTKALRDINRQLIYEIADRQLVEEQLRQSQEMLQLIMDNIPQSVFWKDTTSVYLGCNRNFAQMIGEDLPRVTTDAAKLFEQRQINYEYRFFHKDGSVRWMYDQAKLVLDDTGNPLEIVGYWSDITERKQLEEELKNALQKEKELNDLKSRFIAMTSHEFRTPLSTILSSAELLQHYRHKWTQEKQLSHLQRIQNAVHHMTEMLDNVLLIGRAESGKLNLALEEFDLIEYCQYVVEELELNIKNKQVISFKSQNESIQCYMDKKLLWHILSNLLSNAMKYSPENSFIEFTLQLDAKQAIFEIQDQGIGIPPDDLPHIFESFHRATNVGHIQGTGLGLAIVKRCVDTHKGDITVTSQVGLGTTFNVRLPIGNGEWGIGNREWGMGNGE